MSLFLAKLKNRYTVQAASLSQETMDWLRKQKTYGAARPSEVVRRELEPYVLKGPTLLYKGIYAEEEEEAGELPVFWEPEAYRYTPTRLPESWTRSKREAIKFAQRGEGGFLVKYLAKPEDSIVDFSLLPGEAKEQLKNMHEEEVVLLFSGPFDVTGIPSRL